MKSPREDITKRKRERPRAEIPRIHTWKQTNIKCEKTLAKALPKLANTCPKSVTKTIAKFVKFV